MRWPSSAGRTPTQEPALPVPGAAHGSPEAAPVRGSSSDVRVRSTPPAVAYLLPGLPSEGSGGSHSIVQEARGLRALGAAARVCVPSDQALAIASRLYGNEDGLFVPYRSEPEVGEAVGDCNVVVATEHPSIGMLELLLRGRPQLVCAYYVQDYEPLFAPAGSPRSDRALLSYRAIPDLVLFAKTRFLCNLVTARHGVGVAKVAPSLDGTLFHAEDRAAHDGPLRVAAMVRPRTPRRRPQATRGRWRSCSSCSATRSRRSGSAAISRRSPSWPSAAARSRTTSVC